MNYIIVNLFFTIRKYLINIEKFDFQPGRLIKGKYQIRAKIGSGLEGEVYRIRETSTGIERAAKFFYPQHNLKNRTIIHQAKKLHKLRHCPILISYHNQETIKFKNQSITVLISDYIRGDLLSEYLNKQRGKCLTSFQALHLLYALAKGMDHIHSAREYHGDLHTDNIIVQKFGLGFDLKLVDFFHWKIPKNELIQEDVYDLIRIFYDALGGVKKYKSQPQAIKSIICGLKKTFISKKFKTAGQLKQYLENLEWDK